MNIAAFFGYTLKNQACKGGSEMVERRVCLFDESDIIGAEQKLRHFY
jgi:hypothetical protein